MSILTRTLYPLRRSVLVMRAGGLQEKVKPNTLGSGEVMFITGPSGFRLMSGISTTVGERERESIHKIKSATM